MSAHAEATPWGQWVGHCTRCAETIAGNPNTVKTWADVHDSVAHWEVRDLLGAAPDFTGGLSVDEYMNEQRGRGQE